MRGLINMDEVRNIIFCTCYGEKPNLPNPPEVTNENWDYVILTDDTNNKVEGWDTMLLRERCDCPEREAKLVKCLLPVIWPVYENSIYIDAEKYLIDCDPGDLFDFVKTDFAALRHRETNCTYTEIKRQEIMRPQIADELQAVRAINKAFSLREKAGLFDNSILVRRHSEEVINTMKSWANDIKHCKRDQCSLVKNMIANKLMGQYLYVLNYKHYWNVRRLSDIYSEIVV